ncbi:hypothetical protein OG625_14405 [Streptomyces sp. NBC_01351]|uniref:hypothetical protein n=1 Tax=Streptomyces sp. NBC_01351 TaxID=2903833 RepID=UPI002E37AA7B|nr:hypothetical protein [Streptomyces sp. NBC_01351]
MSARRPLLTALGATTLLTALWFVPSAGATAPGPAAGRSGSPAAANTAPSAAPTAQGARGDSATPPPQPAPLMLADTGSADTTPYLLGGTLFLGIGAGFVTFSVHRSRSAL